MRTTLALLLVSLFVYAGGAMATETKQTQAEQAKWLVKSLSSHVLEIKESKDHRENIGKAQIVSDGKYTKGQARENKFILAPGESFQGPSDHHSSSNLTMVAIDSKGLKLSYEMRFDHRSFGKDLITIDKGTIVLPLNSVPHKSALSVSGQTSKLSKSDIFGQFETLRKEIPEAKTISEQNGVSIPDAKGVYYTCTRLASVANSLKLTSKEDALATLSYLEDDDYKLRFIAATALCTTFKTHPHGLSMSDVEERKSPRHAKLVEIYRAAIEKHFTAK